MTDELSGTQATFFLCPYLAKTTNKISLRRLQRLWACADDQTLLDECRRGRLAQVFPWRNQDKQEVAIRALLVVGKQCLQAYSTRCVCVCFHPCSPGSCYLEHYGKQPSNPQQRIFSPSTRANVLSHVADCVCVTRKECKTIEAALQTGSVNASCWRTCNHKFNERPVFRDSSRAMHVSRKAIRWRKPLISASSGTLPEISEDLCLLTQSFLKKGWVTTTTKREVKLHYKSCGSRTGSKKMFFVF